MSSEAEGAYQAVPPPPACLPHWLGGATSEPQEEGVEEWGSSVSHSVCRDALDTVNVKSGPPAGRSSSGSEATCSHL